MILFQVCSSLFKSVRVYMSLLSLYDYLTFFYFYSIKRVYMPKIVKKTEDTTRMVKQLSGIGVTHDMICSIAGISKPTLYKYYDEELKLGKAQSTVTVANNLFRMATGYKSDPLTASIFWLKTQAGWKETDVVEINNVSDENDRFAELIKRVRHTRLSQKDSNKSIN